MKIKNNEIDEIDEAIFGAIGNILIGLPLAIAVIAAIVEMINKYICKFY